MSEQEIQVRHVTIWLCQLCLSGKGGECHVPGCALWMNRAPDLDITDKVEPVITNMLGRAIVALSEWIDKAPVNAARNPEAATWGRLAKVGEEAGEVIAAYIGVTAQNPRKGVTHTEQDVTKELLDVAVTALAAYEHVIGHRGTSIEALRRHTEWLLERVGISLEPPSAGHDESGQ